MIFLFHLQSKMVSVRGKSLIKKVLQAYLQPALILMCVAGGIRLGAGLVWAYNVKTYFNQLYCGVDVGVYLSWVPIVGGTLGALLGGLMSDRLARLNGYKGRMWVLIFSQVRINTWLLGHYFQWPFSLFLSDLCNSIPSGYALPAPYSMGVHQPHTCLYHR